MILKISGNICPTMVGWIQKFQSFMCHTSRDIIRYFPQLPVKTLYVSITCICINIYVCICAEVSRAPLIGAPSAAPFLGAGARTAAPLFCSVALEVFCAPALALLYESNNKAVFNVIQVYNQQLTTLQAYTS